MTARLRSFGTDPIGRSPLEKWRGLLDAPVYAVAGNQYAQMAENSEQWRVSRAVLIGRALTCWEAALARGFVCC